MTVELFMRFEYKWWTLVELKKELFPMETAGLSIMTGLFAFFNLTPFTNELPAQNKWS